MVVSADQIQAAFDAMTKERTEQDRNLRKPTALEVRQSRVQFAIYPQAGIPSFTLGCIYCNTGYEGDYFAARLGERMAAFFARHADCTPGCLPPETRKSKGGSE